MTTKTEFDYEVTDSGPGYNRPQQMGNRLWGPMFALAIMAFPVALILSWVRAATIADATGVPDLEDAAQLGHLVGGFGFLGFLGVFSAISFAIARILGRFRKGGGEIQESVGNDVHTLKMPVTAKIFIIFMMMGMMALAGSVVGHFVAAAGVGSWSLESVARWAEVLDGIKRIGVAMYLFGIAFGLGTIITVLRFQTHRVAQLAR